MASTHSDSATTDVLAPPNDSHGGALALPEMAYPLPAGYGAAPAPANELLYGSFNQKWLVNCLRRRWLMAALLGAFIAGLTGLALWLLFPASSRTSAYLMMNFGDTSAFGNTEKPLTQKQLEQEQLSQLTLIKSATVLNAALTKQTIRELPAVISNQPDPIQWMFDELKVSFPNDGKVMEVRYDGDENPEDMVDIINAIIDSYYTEVVTKERINRLQLSDDLEKVERELTSNLSKKMQTLRGMIETADGADSDTAEIEIKTLLDKIHFIQAELSKQEKTLLDNEVMKEVAIRQASSPARIENLVAAALSEDPMIANYQSQLFEIETALMARQSIEKRRNSPEVLRMQQAKQQVEAMMQQYRAKAERELREQIANMPNEELQAIIAQYRIVKEKTEATINEMEEELKQSEDALLRLGARDPEIEMLQSQIENDQEVVRELEIRLQQLKIERQAREAAGAETERHEKVQIMQPAMSQENINNIERASIAGIGGLAAFALTCYGVALVEFRKRRLNGPDDVDEGLGIRVLGVLPSTSARKSLAGGSLVAAQVAESIDSVRATLMHASTKMRRQIVLITSAETMEGATTVAANLAMSLARAGRRTLLIDGDLRAPSLHGLFGLNLDGGFCEVLRSEIDVTDAVQTTQTENLWLLTAGVCDRIAVQNLATDQLDPILEQLRTQFDFIIIDGPPVLKISDSLSLGRRVDGAILTVLRDHSEVRKINKAVELLDSLGVRMIGAVVNGVPVRADRRVARLQAGARQKQLPGKAPKAKKEKKAKPAKPSRAAKQDEPAAPSTPVAELDPLEEPTSRNADIDIDDFEIELDD